MLTTGDRAPDFELPDQDATPRRLSRLLTAGPVVLFFYPGAMTTGCTAESCHFRDLAAEFAQLGAQRVGISLDPVDKQKQFADKHSFGYPLLSDGDGSVARAFGVRRRFLTPVRRATFVIGVDATILATVSNELQMKVHADRALAALRSATVAE
jgi:peroxiredoxin Q/BCP